MGLKTKILSHFYYVPTDFDFAQSDSHSERSRTVKIYIARIIAIFVIVLLTGIAVQAQQIKATAKLDSTNILLGDQINLILEIDHPKDAKIGFPAIADSIGKIEVLKKLTPDTIELDDKAWQKQVVKYTITCFDSGYYTIDPQWFTITQNGNTDSVSTNPVFLQVHSMQIDTTRGLTDIKMPYSAPVTLKEVTPYILGVLLAGAILFLLLYSIKRKKKNQPLFRMPEKPKEPAHIVALRELDRIKDEKLWQKDKTKQYYSEVTDVIRTYIEDRFEIRAMEQTTDEILDSFRIRKDLLNEKSIGNLSQILTLADLVKFAKYHPLPDDDNLTLVNSYFFVNETKKEELKKPEEPAKTDEVNEDDKSK